MTSGMFANFKIYNLGKVPSECDYFRYGKTGCLSKVIHRYGIQSHTGRRTKDRITPTASENTPVIYSHKSHKQTKKITNEGSAVGYLNQ